MNSGQLKALFWKMIQGDEQAAKELDDYFKGEGSSNTPDGSIARQSIERAIYDITYELVQKRMNKEFSFLIDRRSAGSILHNAWIRALKTPIVDINNLESFCRYLLSCLRYAFIDVVRDQRKWDGTNHDPLGRATSESGVIDVALAQAQDEGSLDPAKTVLWIEFHEKIASLPDDERFVFEPHYYLGMSRRMISVRLGISEHEVRRLLLLAKQHLGDVFPET